MNDNELKQSKMQTFTDLSESDIVVCLAGNPNVGKSTIFNYLTGLNQHTGNWPGKTVSHAVGEFEYEKKSVSIVDLPGTYSLLPHSFEEKIARDFICFGRNDVTVVVCDATTFERSLNLVLQILEITNKVVVCLNLEDQAKKKKIEIDVKELEKELRVPIISTTALKGIGMKELKDKIIQVSQIESSELSPIEYDEVIEKCVDIIESDSIEISRFFRLRLIYNDEAYLEQMQNFSDFRLSNDKKLSVSLEKVDLILSEHFKSKSEIHDSMVTSILKKANGIAEKTLNSNSRDDSFDRKLDKIFTSKLTGIPIMLIMLSLVFFITIRLANYPSMMLAEFFGYLGDEITILLDKIGSPWWVTQPLMDGVYSVSTWVISVMLPPMAIFFPLFTLLEDFGYLPRVAFNLDHCFKKCNTCGKQSLCMAMGFGCNAAGVVGCRIIDSPRERLIAIITNNFVPCNGRFPTIIAIISMFFVSSISKTYSSLASALILTSIIILSVIVTLMVSFLLSKTLLKGQVSSFTLELPSYRTPKIRSVLVRSLIDRTLFVLLRAIKVAAPVGLIIWLIANLKINGNTALYYLSNFLDPLGKLMGLDGVIVMAFVLGFPANEIVLPIILMAYLSQGSLVEMTDFSSIFEILSANGWTFLTGICFILFSLMHFPCSTTLLTIKNETGSRKWTLISFLVPTLMGIIVCSLVNFAFNLF